MSRAQKPALSIYSSETLQVLDMGLDFRSYLSRVDENGVPILGNVISYGAAKVADIFEPTVGLLVTIVHLVSQSATTGEAATWLKTYDTIQKVYLDQVEPASEGAKYAQSSRDIIANVLSGNLTDNKSSTCEKLLILLDFQSGIRGPQSPSQRRIARDPKGAFCNLHLADHKCYQEFACNQLHLHEVGPVRHRQNFCQRLVEVLMKENTPSDEIMRRVKDSVFFARYGNKVTVRFQGYCIPFFKTLYTDGRLEQAFRYHQIACINAACVDDHCQGIHPQDRRTVVYTKSVDLHNPQQIATELEDEAKHILFTVESAKKVAMKDALINLTSPIALLSPTTELWRNTVRDYVRQSGIPQVVADESLLKTLQGAKGSETPLSTESMTPLLDELDTYAFNSSMSSAGSEPRC